MRNRINESKRVAYMYSCCELTSDQEALDKQWRSLKYAHQMSSIYCASHLGVKMRSVGNRARLTDEEIRLLAVTDHNRWNVEKLLMGWEALPKAERERQHAPEGLLELKKLRRQFKHYCIEPYSELVPDDKKYDTLIIKNIGDII